MQVQDGDSDRQPQRTKDAFALASKRGLSQEKIAAKLGVSRSTVGGWSAEGWTPRQPHLRQPLADLLGVPDLFDSAHQREPTVDELRQTVTELEDLVDSLGTALVIYLSGEPVPPAVYEDLRREFGRPT